MWIRTTPSNVVLKSEIWIETSSSNFVERSGHFSDTVYLLHMREKCTGSRRLNLSWSQTSTGWSFFWFQFEYHKKRVIDGNESEPEVWWYWSCHEYFVGLNYVWCLVMPSLQLQVCIKSTCLEECGKQDILYPWILHIGVHLTSSDMF